MNALQLCTRAASVGDIFTGIVHPATATHREMSPARRAKLGISEGLLRVSAGIEEVEDIIADIEQAFLNGELHGKRKTKNADLLNCSFFIIRFPLFFLRNL